MMNIENFYTEIKNIVDHNIKSKISDQIIDIKDDKSLVTKIDYEIEKDIIQFVESYYNINSSQIIAEESFDLNLFDQFDFDSNFLIIDPIDGTENFAHGLNEWGSVLTLKADDKFFNLIYVPSSGALINDHSVAPKVSRFNTLEAYSTKSLILNKFTNADSCRIFGSSSFAFNLFLTGKIKKYFYYGGAKIWDCYTGLFLSHKMNANIHIENGDIKNWLKQPTFKTSFSVSW